MDMKKTTVLSLSLILNVGLGFHMFFKNNADIYLTSTGGEPSDILATGDPIDLPANPNHGPYYQDLVILGLSDSQAKQLLFQKLKSAHSPSNPNAQDIYWESNKELQLANIDQKIAAQQIIRDKLIALFGQSAWDEPSFSEIFRPLQPQFPFLLPREQIALQKLQADHQISMMASQTKSSFSSSEQTKNPRPLTSAPSLFSVDVSAVLSEKSAFEYDLRMSFLARQLRESSVEFNEESFRKTYRILAALYPKSIPATAPNKQQTPGKTLVDSRMELEDILGSEGTLQVMVALDPDFQKMQRRASRLNLDQEQLMIAYEIALDARKALLDGIRTRQDNPEIGLQMIREAANNHWNQLSQELGDEVTEQLLGSSSRQIKNQLPQVLAPQTTIIKN